MADGGITEAAMPSLAAAADTAAAGAAKPPLRLPLRLLAAAALPEVASAGAGLLGTAAAAAPEVAAATVPEVAAATVPGNRGCCARKHLRRAAPEVAAATRRRRRSDILLGAAQSVPEAGAVPAARGRAQSQPRVQQRAACWTPPAASTAPPGRRGLGSLPTPRWCNRQACWGSWATGGIPPRLATSWRLAASC